MLSRKQFDKVVERAIRRIPDELRERLDNVIITVQRRPSADLLEEMGLPPDEPLLGVFQGYPQVEHSGSSPPLFADMIILFQEPLEETCKTIEELEQEIELTVVHEIAHFFDISEERLDELGYE